MNMIWLLLSITILILGLVLLWWWYRQRPETPDPKAGTPLPPREEPPYGFLIRQGENAEHHGIMAFPLRIGRSSKNDLCIDDPSISRRHAEIRRDQDGQTLIVDMESLNGIYINNKKTGKCILHEGDRIEIGDIVFLYTLADKTTEGSGD